MLARDANIACAVFVCDLPPAGVAEFAKELVVLMRLQHEHIVTFYGVYQ